MTEAEIEHAVREHGLTTVEDVTNFTKAGGACGGCHGEIRTIIERINGSATGEKTSAVPEKQLTTLQKIDRIRNVLENDVKPVLAKDGGDCELIDVEGNTVLVKLHGHCAGCAFSNMTLISVVERNLREKVSEQLTVKLA